MSEWRQFSRLPESEQYWLDLRQRVESEARPFLVPHQRQSPWLDAVLAGGVLAAAAVIGVLIMPAPTAVATPSLQASLAPTDPVALELLNRDQAPHISGLLPAYAARPVQ